jgi:hypothetical protein
MHDAPAHFSRAVRDFPITPLMADGEVQLNPLDFSLWGHLKHLCLQLLLTTKRYFTIALWIPAELSVATPVSLNGCGGL